MQDVQSHVEEVLENQIWIGVAWREAFVVPFIPGTVPGWSDACFEPVEWLSSGQPAGDGDKGWCIIRSPATDADGWVYGTAFDHLREDRPGGRASKRANDRIRSRLWRRVDNTQQEEEAHGQQQQHQQQQQEQHVASASSRAAAATSAAGAPTEAASGQAKARWQGAVHAVQSSMPGAVKRASFAGMVNTFLKLIKDAAARHNSVMITPDITGWFFIISTHTDELKRQQLGQLHQLMWFSREQQLQAAMQPGGLGTNPAGVMLKGAAAALIASEASKQQVAAAAAAAAGGQLPRASGAATASADSDSSTSSSSNVQKQPSGQHVLVGRPYHGLKVHIGSGGSSSSSSAGSRRQQQQPSGNGSSGKPPSNGAAGGAAGVQLHVGAFSLLDDLLAGAQYSQAAYGYVAAAGHLSNLGNAIKMLATLPHFNAITGASLEANIRAMHTLAGFCPQDVLLAAWHNDTFRPCHYVAVDMKRGNIVLGIRGSLELGDLETDITAAPLPFEFQGVAGWVHEGLLAAAAYVVSNTVDALAEAAQRCPGWPLVVAGHSLGGGVAALVTLLLQQPGAAPRGISGVRCITIGPAAVLSQELCGLCEEYVTSIILGADAIPRLSTFSVESLLLDLVNASVSRRVTTQLAATTSSVAASTADAINSLAAGLSRLANTATNNVVSNVNSMKSSLASITTLPPFPLIDGALGANLLGLSAGLLQQGDSLYSAGTGSVEMTGRLRQQLLQQEQAAVMREASDGGLKQVHFMLQDDRQQQELRRASFEQQAAGQQQQQQQQHTQVPAASPMGGGGGGGGGVTTPLPKLGKMGGLPEPPTAATEFDAPEQTAAAGNGLPSVQEQATGGPHTGQKSSQAGSSSSSCASATGSKAVNPSNTTSQPGVPRRQQEQGGGGSSSVIKPPGGPKLVSGGPAAGNIMIFSKHDDVSIISGIQEAWAGLKPPGAIAGPGCNSSSTAEAPAPAAAAASASASAGTAVRPSSQPLGNSSSTHSNMTAFGVEAQQHSAPPAAAAPADAEGPAAVCAGSSNSSMVRSTSEPALQQWASDGLQGLGEPSWVKLSRSSDGGAGAGSSGQQQQQHDSKAAGDAAVGDSTVHALEFDLKRTARLYPPGRILWILSEELVGPAAHQLMTAVAAHLQPAAAAATAAAAAAERSGSGAISSSSTSTNTSSGGSHLKPPSPAHMDMPSSIMGPGSKPVLRTKQQQPRPSPSPKQPQQQQQHKPLSSQAIARDAATAHAVAAASAKHILQDVHSLEARRAAAAALQAAQHEHPPLHLEEQQSPGEAAAQLEQQLRLQERDLQAAKDAVPDDRTPPAAAAAAVEDREGAARTAAGRPLVQDSGDSTASSSSKTPQTPPQQKPLRTLRPPAAAVQMTNAGSTAAGTPNSSTAGLSSRATPAAAHNRSSSEPMEVDGSAAAAGRAGGAAGFPSSWGTADINPQELPQELRELIQILGIPCDAASALAIGYKKQVLLQHFWQQRQREASEEAAAAAAAAAASQQSRRARASSDSHLMKFEDMIRAVDDVGGGGGGGAAPAAPSPWGSADAAAALPQLELVDQSWWGTLSSLGSSSTDNKPPSVSHPPSAASAGNSNSVAGFPAAAAMHTAGGSTQLSSTGGAVEVPFGSHMLSSLGSVDGEDGAGQGAAQAGGLPSTQQQQAQQPQPQRNTAEQQQQLQLSVFQESDEYVLWAAQQAAQHQQQQQQEEEEQRRQQQAAATAAAAAAVDKQQLSLPQLAAESLVELAQLPERLAESLGGLKLGGSGSTNGIDDAGCGDLGPGAAGLAALCAPMLGLAGDEPAAAAAPAISTSGLRLPPVVVMPERDVFSKLLLHKTAVLDHLPSNYVQALTELKEAYSSLHQQMQHQQQQLVVNPQRL